MLAPDVEERFRKIEDNLLVMSELQRRYEARTDDKVDHLKAIQNAMAQWMDKMADQQERMEERQERMEGLQEEMQGKLNALIDAQIDVREALAELSRTVDRSLKARMNGGPN